MVTFLGNINVDDYFKHIFAILLREISKFHGALNVGGQSSAVSSRPMMEFRGTL